MNSVILELNLIAIKTIALREIRRFLRIGIQTILPSMITTALYYLIFGNLIGSRIGEMENIPYMLYIAPGLILMAIITNSYANTVSSFFSAKFQRHLEELIISPVSAHAIVIGYVLGGMARGIIVGIGVYLVSLLFTQLIPQAIFICLFLVLCTSAIFSLAGLLNGILAKNFDDTSFVATFILTPLVYLGGVFYSVKMLPELWQYASFLNPILYLVNGLRYAFFADASIHFIYATIGSPVLILALYLICVRLIQRGIPLEK